MTKFKNIKEEISIFHIKEDTFIKVLIYDETTNAVNVDIYYKVNNKYKSITQTELPKEIVTHIATKPSEKISEDELKEFKAFLDKTKITEANTKINLEDESSELELYCSGANQYSYLKPYAGKTVTLEINPCNYNKTFY